MKFILPAILTLGACSPSPLYVDRAQIGTNGEVPRDARGEPIWSAIAPAPAPAPPLAPNSR
jgi:hypothetical protein